MKARIPKHREFIINMDKIEDEKLKNECWSKLTAILDSYKVDGKTVYSPSFIEDNEEKVKALQEEYPFTYTVELK